ncbi:galectin-6-like isoform X2 [Anabas testudineus]|uniref:Galectin n=1 Tax=Anabas testudineus TaxID=64144 RepID=A0A7N6BVK2_ANATE|nr:galectin-6-like isoform X2 [Anabas testudineus]
MFVAPPGYQPVYNPTIPYLTPIGGGLREGMSIYVHGTVPENTTRFYMNLLCGESESSDVAFHFNPRFDGWDKVVFNSCQNGFWEAEEKIHHMPFHRGRVFEMVITATSHGYKVKVNGKEFHHFKHRVPMERVRALYIAGDVLIETVNVIGGGMGGGMYGGMGMGGMAGGYPGGGMQFGYPAGMGGGMGGGYPGGMAVGMGGGLPGAIMGGGDPGGMGGIGGDYPGANLPIMCGQPDFHPSVPYSIMLPQGMFHRRTVIIRGMVLFGGNRMCINFVVSRSRDIAFHLNHRVREGVLMRNSMIGGCWGQEELELSTNPFVEGQYFEISIRCGRHKFKVFVNGLHLFDYHHRFHSFNEIDMLEIEGDVQLSYVHF